MHLEYGTFDGEFFGSFEFGFLQTQTVLGELGNVVFNGLSGPVACGFRNPVQGHHATQLLLDRTKFRKRLVELLAGRGVFHRFRDPSAVGIEHSCCQFDAPDIQGVDGDLESSVPFSEHILRRNDHFVQEYLSGGGGSQSHFVFLFTQAQTLGTFLNDEG